MDKVLLGVIAFLAVTALVASAVIDLNLTEILPVRACLQAVPSFDSRPPICVRWD